MKTLIQKKYIHSKKGFVILFAMLVSSLMLLISGGVYNLVQKQLVLSSYARESQVAFYAADSALECALFYDVSAHIPAPETTYFPAGQPSSYSSPGMRCGAGNPRAERLNVRTGGDNYTDSFVFRYASEAQEVPGIVFGRPFLDSGCAYVLVEKKVDNTDPANPEVSVRITSTGFNVCVKTESGQFDAPDTNDPRLLERRISVQYIRP
ncbi:MAG: hypothetical protein ACPGTS_01475 [Minisyncoccia bacterium]